MAKAKAKANHITQFQTIKNACDRLRCCRIIDKVLLDCRQLWCSASSEQGKMTKKKKKLRGRRKWMATNRRRRCCLQHWDPERQRPGIAIAVKAGLTKTDFDSTV
ncbi:uncharacterized protein LOC135672818 isoform X2 [Musa acuminata AAA Group]|uniref:uncharacterized protein LOC135582602 isoform X2 n=1 Tax=Musa acuminata AAA Group TaxID=214697 RepID=UPI0031D96C50